MVEKKKKTNAKKKVAKKNKEKICEVFNVTKDGKEKQIRVCDLIEKKSATKNQIENQNKLLRNFLIVIGVVALVFIFGYYGIQSIRHFDYRGVEFNVVQEGELILYQTAFPVKYNGQTVPYNIYLRNDPRNLEDVLFTGEINLKKDLLIKSESQNLFCDGDWSLAIGNLAKLKVLGFNVFQNNSLSCDEQGRYSFVRIRESDTTSVEQVGASCYNINVNSCEILKATEKFMVETFVKVSSLKN